jgi:16S rRNA (guanine(966)-N(2))-methyltransferase RsmD
MRIISGIYKHRRFDVPRTFKARPTTDFAKESLFNILSNYFDFASERPVALDLFAGTGSITLELLSRGCAKVVCVELDRDHYLFIRRVLQQLHADNCLPLNGDVFKFVQRRSEQYDLIFADPPYELPTLSTLPDLIFAHDLLKPGGIFVLEHGKRQTFDTHPHFLEHRAYGSVNFTFFRQSTSNT